MKVALASLMVVLGEGAATGEGTEDVAVVAAVGPADEGGMNWNCCELGPTRKTVGSEVAAALAAATAAAAAGAVEEALEEVGVGIETGTVTGTVAGGAAGIVAGARTGAGGGGGTHSSV